MLVFFYGTDSYRLKRARDDLTSRYKAKYSSGVNLFSFDMTESDDTSVLESAIKSSSFFNEHKLIVCKNIFGKKSAAETLAKLTKDQNLATDSDITLAVIENLPEKELTSKNAPLFKILSAKESLVKILEPLGDLKLTEWVKKEFETRNCSISTGAVKKLTDIIGNDSWALMNEIDKLSANKNGGAVTEGDIKLLVAPKIDLNIFNLIDTVGSKNHLRALELLYRELKSGREAHYILTMITYQFRNLMIVKDLQKRGLSQGEISKKIGLHPFVAKKALSAGNLFTSEELIKTYGRLLAIDTSFKMGTTSLEDSLYGLIFSRS